MDKAKLEHKLGCAKTWAGNRTGRHYWRHSNRLWHPLVCVMTRPMVAGLVLPQHPSVCNIDGTVLKTDQAVASTGKCDG